MTNKAKIKSNRSRRRLTLEAFSLDRRSTFVRKLDKKRSKSYSFADIERFFSISLDEDRNIPLKLTGFTFEKHHSCQLIVDVYEMAH